MKKFLSLFLFVTMIVSLVACGSSNTNTSSSSDESKGIEVDENLLTVEITIPHDLFDMGEEAEKMTQEEADATVKENGFISGVVNENGDVTYKMTKKAHKEYMKKFKAEIDEGFQEMVGSEDYPNFTEIMYNDNFTEISVKTKSKELDFNETFSVLGIWVMAALYNAFDNNEGANIHIQYFNAESNELLHEFNSEELEDENESSKSAEIPQKEFKGNYEEMGSGDFTISTQSGTSENGNIPFVFVNQEEYDSAYIDYKTLDLDGAHLTYIYVDGVEKAKDQMVETWSSIYLENCDGNGIVYKGNPLETGLHDIEVVQFDNDKPDGKVIFYRKLQYQVKEK